MEFSSQEHWRGLPSLLHGIFLTQGSNLGLLHCRQILNCLSHQTKGHPISKQCSLSGSGIPLLGQDLECPGKEIPLPKWGLGGGLGASGCRQMGRPRASRREEEAFKLGTLSGSSSVYMRIIWGLSEKRSGAGIAMLHPPQAVLRQVLPKLLLRNTAQASPLLWFLHGQSLHGHTLLISMRIYICDLRRIRSIKYRAKNKIK